ncbi:uncharacterized protein LOC117289054 [Asterias rubens]|uniref:uncharacterized protein LOC117289054 n=1 Tax=Asterias rubens TaxID=7604 RepID=UPI001455BAAB|nr:uncharacterized protein LOC117289054 [Asterias rubens]
MADMGAQEVGGASSGTESSERKCGMEMSYVKTLNGLLMAKKIGWSLIAFFLCIFSGVSVTSILFGVVVFSGLMLCIMLFFVFAFGKAKQITRINVYKFDFIVSFLGTIAYFIVSLWGLFSFNPVLIAACVFGFIAMLSFGASVYLNFKRWRQNKSTTSSDNTAYNPTY